MILQNLKYIIGDNPIDMAEKYFSIMSIMNNWELAQREIQLLAFTSVNGNIGNDRSKEEFVKKHTSSLATINNIISKLRKKGLLYKEGRAIKVHKVLSLDFRKSLTLIIKLDNGSIE